jgi:flagellar hook assembly protein FlgD
LRHAAIALVLAFVAGIVVAAPVPGNGVPSASAATTHPKVVIIVGAVHAQTDSYRQRGDAAYAEAIKYTPNVVKVYSPNATWAAVKSAAQGASILIYMGHGNGWPSPYTYDPNYTTKDGFGLNAAAGQGDHNNKYYGEPSIATLGLAPNAVVLLNHLCYAAGNSEPGHAEPTLAVAKQRADNYASAFLKAGARAVIADGHMGPSYYIRALFTTRQTVDQVWRGAPNVHGNDFSFPSVRSPGYTVQMDPEIPTGRYYRAITGKMTLRTEEVTGAAYAATDTHPVAISVPGAAAAGAGGAAIHDDPTLVDAPVATLAPDARVRVLAAGATSTGAPVYQVQTLDGSVAGYAAATGLVPRDSASPAVWEVDDGTGAFSPNADGRQDAIQVKGRFSEPVAWSMTFADANGVIGENSGTGTSYAATWDAVTEAGTAPDGTYTWTLTASDAWGNPPVTASGSVVVDTVAPSFMSAAAASTPPAAPAFSPNGDGKTDTVSLGVSSNEAGLVEAQFLASGTTQAVRTAVIGVKAGTTATLTWDGRTAAGAYAPDGRYTVRVAPRDLAGNLGMAEDREVWLVGAMSRLTSSPALFYPNDKDRLAKSTTTTFVLARPARVSWRIMTLGGTTVRTIRTSADLTPGTHKFVWDGKTDAGTYAPAGTYAIYASAGVNGVWIGHKTWVELNAFSFKVSDTTPTRGQTVTVTTTSAESLKAAPTLRVAQPGIAAWSVRMVKVTGNTWKATIRFKSSKTGQVVLRISGYDADGRWQATYRGLPLG